MSDYLYATPYRMKQGPDMYHFSSDTELLGRFLKLNSADRVLDAGTNNGALLCYAAMWNPASMAGIDLFPEVIALAEENLERNGIDAELKAVRLQDYMHEPFDVIICNPPYFTNPNEKLKKENHYLRAARHDDYLKPEELFSNSARLLEDGGRLNLIIPADSCRTFFSTAFENGFSLKRFCPVYTEKGGELRRVLLEFIRNPSASLEVQLPVYLDQLHDPLARNDLLKNRYSSAE